MPPPILFSLRPPSPPRSGRLALGLVFFALLAGLATATPAPGLLWRATRDFAPVRTADFAAFYAETKDPDPSLHGLAVNPRQHRDRFAAAVLVFAGPAGTYTLALHAVAEEDGESVYRLAVNETLLESRTNPVTAEKRLRVVHRWAGVALRPGDRLAVHFAGRSNGRIPEGDNFAWSRGRWRALEAIPETPR